MYQCIIISYHNHYFYLYDHGRVILFITSIKNIMYFIFENLVPKTAIVSDKQNGLFILQLF